MATPNTHHGPERIHRYLHTSSANRQSDTVVFFIGAGGIMMSSLALLTHRAGFTVAGSDRTETPLTRTLEEDGIVMSYGHSTANLDRWPTCALVVYTVAISPDNPEYVRAMERGIPLVSRADYVGYLMTHYQNRVGVAGMHGKSTCTSMCAQLFMSAKADPTVLSGAEYAPMGGAYRIGGDTHFLFEACEYMDSFLDFRPTVAVLLNIELEHVDYFKSIEQICDSFSRFASLTGEGGTVIYNLDDPITVKAAMDARVGRRVSFSLNDPSADFYARVADPEAAFPQFAVYHKGSHLFDVTLPVTGLHQVYNALAATASAHACGLPLADCKAGLEAFKGAGRRMEYKGTVAGAEVYDDYAHHPTEIRSTLAGAAHLCHSRHPDGRLFCVFQPHTYSRTAALFDDFVSAFDAADRLLLIDIYAARETNTYGVSSKGLAEAIGSRALYCDSIEATVAQLLNELTPHDLLVVMGAGDVIHVTQQLKPYMNNTEPACINQ